jgi:hypothetical protein
MTKQPTGPELPYSVCSRSKANEILFNFFKLQGEDHIMSDSAIQEQQPAPDFTLPAVGNDDVVKNGQVHLADLKGHTIVLYFYPKED